MKRHAWRLTAAVLAAGILHTASGRHLAALDPIATLLGGHDAGVVAAAVGVAAARLFLYLVAPAWAAHLAVTTLAFIASPPRRSSAAAGRLAEAGGDPA